VITKKITRYELNEKETRELLVKYMTTSESRLKFAMDRFGGLTFEIETECEEVE